MSKIAPLFTWRSAFSSAAGPENPVTRHVLLAISLYMSEKGDGAFPSMEKLSEDTGLSVRTIKKHVPLAEELGWLNVVKKKGTGKGWRRNDYKATIPPSYYEKMKQIEEQAVNEMHQEGSEPDAPPKNKVVNVVHDGGESECNMVVNQVHPITPVNSPMNTPERRAREKISAILKNLTPSHGLDSLLSLDGFWSEWVDYWQTRKNEFSQWPHEVTVRKGYQKLIALQQKGHDPRDVLRQSTENGNKALYPIRNFNNKSNNHAVDRKSKGDKHAEALQSL